MREKIAGALARACAYFYCGLPRSWSSMSRMCQVQRSARIPSVILTDEPTTEIRVMQPKSKVRESKLDPADHLTAPLARDRRSRTDPL